MISKIDKYRYASMPQEKIEKFFLQACESGNLELIQYFLWDKNIPNVSIEYNNYEGLFAACNKNHLEVVNFFLKNKKLNKNPPVDIAKGRLLRIACYQANIEMIDYLLSFENTKKLHVNQNDDEIFKSLMNLFSKRYELVQTLIVKYDMKKTQGIIDFLDQKNNGVEDKRLVNEWFEKRDLKNAMEFVFEKKEQTSKVKKFKI